MMRKCPNCGSTIKNNDVCPVCGKRIGIVEYRVNDRPKINKSIPTPKKVSSKPKNKKHLKTQNLEHQHVDNSNDNQSRKGSIVSSLLGILCIVGVMLIVVSGILVPDDTSNVSQKPNLTNNVTVINSNQVMFQVNVIYNGRWSGSIGVNDILNKYNQNGSKSVKFEDYSENDTISTSIQKNDPSDDELKVQVSKNGVLVKEESTKTPYGIVTISI